MINYKVGLIGCGKMGKIFIKEIKKHKNFKIIRILNQRLIKKNPKIVKDFFKSKKINLIVIASPVSTHFKYLEFAYKNNKNVIVEKPLVENINQLKKLVKVNRNYNKKIMIHHNDVLNFQKFKILDNSNMVHKVEMIYGKKEKKNAYSKPFFDWLPHPLSMIINHFGVPIKFKVVKYLKVLKTNLVSEDLQLEFILNRLKIFVKFSNKINKPTKKIIIYSDKNKIIYDGYIKKHLRSVKLLLNKFNEEKKINDVNLNINTYQLLFSIDKKIKKIIT